MKRYNAFRALGTGDLTKSASSLGDSIRQTVDNGWNGMKNFLVPRAQGAAQAISNTGKNFLTGLSAIPEGAGAAMGGLYHGARTGGLGGALGGMANSFEDHVNRVKGNLLSGATGAIAGAGQFFNGAAPAATPSPTPAPAAPPVSAPTVAQTPITSPAAAAPPVQPTPAAPPAAAAPTTPVAAPAPVAATAPKAPAGPTAAQLEQFRRGTGTRFDPKSRLDQIKMQALLGGQNTWASNSAARSAMSGGSHFARL